MTLASVFLLALVVGILVGLFPVLPIWIGPMLLMPFIQYLDVADILVFFFVIAIGSQYFGSVATLLTGIPGETSSLSYAEDSKTLGMRDRVILIRDTAWASLLTGIISLAVTWAVFAWAGEYLATLTSFKIQWLVLALCAVAIVFSSKNFIVSLAMLGLGILLTNKTHPDLPSWAMQIQNYSAETTVFMIAMSAVIIPSMLFARHYHFTQSKNITRTFDLKLDRQIIKPTVQGGLMGYVIGFMPGPAAMMSSILAYKWPKKSTSEGVVRSESANNSAIVAETIPFMGLGIPINTTAVLVYSILTMKLVSWPSAVYAPSIIGMPVYAVVFALAVVATVIFFFLSTRFLDRYCQLLDRMGVKITWLWSLLVLSMIAIDLMINVLDWKFYFIWLCIMSAVGYLLYKTRVSGVALIFGYVLGDKMIWALMQTIEYYS